jgi:hypothetical protein
MSSTEEEHKETLSILATDILSTMGLPLEDDLKKAVTQGFEKYIETKELQTYAREKKNGSDLRPETIKSRDWLINVTEFYRPIKEALFLKSLTPLFRDIEIAIGTTLDGNGNLKQLVVDNVRAFTTAGFPQLYAREREMGALMSKETEKVLEWLISDAKKDLQRIQNEENMEKTK